jgi:Dyp-type peroxidase family
MAKAKYFDAIRKVQQEDIGKDAPLEPFDFEILNAPSWFARFKASAVQKLIPAIYAVSRNIKPMLHMAGVIHITRDAQVREILQRPQDFPTPFGLEMSELAGGPIFLLGLEGAEHDRYHAILRDVMHKDDRAKFENWSHSFTAALLENSNGRIDVVDDLLKRVPSEICLRYFGLSCDDVGAFGDWAIAVSALLFGDPYGDANTRKLALNGAKRLNFVIDDAIRRAQYYRDNNLLRPGKGETLIERLVLLQKQQTISDAEIRALILGMVTGFIPTNMLAATRMFEVLQSRPNAMAMAKAAAAKNDMDAMRKIVFEAGRLNPALAPGQWRFCPRDTTINIDGKTKKVAGGTTLLVSTMSAMRDRRAIAEPSRFWPDRTGPNGEWKEPDLLFGLGVHSCIGKHLAVDQIAALFCQLLKQNDLKAAKGKAGRMRSIGPFPRSLFMTFKTPNARQSMFMVIAPVTSGISKRELDAQIAALGFPAKDDVRAKLDSSNLLHFTSIATVQSDKQLNLMWELSVDGSPLDALSEIAKSTAELLKPIFEHAGYSDREPFIGFLSRHVVELHGKPWGATGLNFNGTGEFSVATIAKQNRFARFIETVITDFLNQEAHRGSHPSLAINYVRRILRQDRILSINGSDDQRALMNQAEEQGFDAFALRPESARLQLTNFHQVSALRGAFNFLISREALVIWIPVMLITAAFGYTYWRMVSFPESASPYWIALSLSVRTLVSTLVAMIAIPLGFLYLVRRAEKTDWIDNSQAPLEHIEAIGQHEDIPGFAHNHILAVSELKPGLLRVMTHTLALWAIRILITFNYRPGFVINMGTIHYARWMRIPGTKTAAFYSNFDGSWESYLEDFITRASWGQTAAWSNWKGFPPTKYMVLNGAEDGDRFKRWVRTKQQIVPFWYSRFPKLTTDQIRNNAIIHAGVGAAQSKSEAEEWLRCFGSMPRVENQIETDEVQALVFNGMKRLKYSTCIVIALPAAGRKMGEWLSWIRGDIQQLDGSDTQKIANGLVSSGIIVPAYGPKRMLRGYALSHSLTITFGDRPLTGDASIYDTDPEPIDISENAMAEQAAKQAAGILDARNMGRRAVFIGCSAAGLSKFSAPNIPDARISDLFPPAFRMGMAKRGRNLGDYGSASADNWRWSDSDKTAPAAEAVMIIYAETPADLEYATEIHRNLLENYGGHVIETTDCAPARIDQPSDQHDIEHFGYRDGISQPIIRGTTRSLKNIPARDIVQPGEFILGYANGQGFHPPSSILPPQADLSQNLPQLSVEELCRFPDFGAADQANAPRDFGRNGTYLVIRELAQDVAGFENFVTRKADEIKSEYRDIYKVFGQYPDADWVKAKLMGRWPNGRPLIGNPVNTPTPAPNDPDAAMCRAAERENDFSYGADDPQGFACPFASHIRRSNPRDSKQPGDPAEQVITNRHRLLRRGRSYTRQSSDGSTEKGLFFVTLCADIERQFEFVQQIWANAPTFHGLAHEPDPIIGNDIPDPDTGAISARDFTVPTPAGSIKLTGMESYVDVKAGGYFFMPSRSALTYLTEISLIR